MKTSTRNQSTGIVRRIKDGDVGSEIAITLPGGHGPVTMITRESRNDLGLNVDSAVIALIKSTTIIIATDLKHTKFSARSRLNGSVCGVERGAANSVITMDLGSGLRLAANVTLQSTERLNPHPDRCATVISKAGSVALGVLAQGRGISTLFVCYKVFRRIL